MRELAKRLGLSARHLTVIDRYASETYDEYARMRNKLIAIPGYRKLARQLYYGQERRQFMLGDILLYILTGRGYWVAVDDAEGFQQFVRVLLYTANLLLIQETLLSARPVERRRFLRRLRDTRVGQFFATGEEREAYEELMEFGGRITVREPRKLYKVMDSLLPRTPGLVLELIVYVQLLVKRLGFSPFTGAAEIISRAGGFSSPRLLVAEARWKCVGHRGGKRNRSVQPDTGKS